MRGKDDIWGVSTFVSINIPSNPSAKQLAKRQNLVYHFGCSPDLKRYNIARHHYAKTLLVATTGKWITPLSASDAKCHGISEACDSFTDGNRKMFVRAPIVPRHIARSTANSYIPGTSEFLRRNRRLERTRYGSASTVDNSDEECEADNFVQGGTPFSPLQLVTTESSAFLSRTVAIPAQPCLGINHPILTDLKKIVLAKNVVFQRALQNYRLDDENDTSCWRSLDCTGSAASVDATDETTLGFRERCANCAVSFKNLRRSRLLGAEDSGDDSNHRQYDEGEAAKRDFQESDDENETRNNRLPKEDDNVTTRSLFLQETAAICAHVLRMSEECDNESAFLASIEEELLLLSNRFVDIPMPPLQLAADTFGTARLFKCEASQDTPLCHQFFVSSRTVTFCCHCRHFDRLQVEMLSIRAGPRASAYSPSFSTAVLLQL